MSEYLAEIAESEARGEIAASYDDIRRTVGVGMVNLIYRHMASRPGVLPWAWGILRHLFSGGAVAAEVESLRGALEDGDVSAAPREAFFAAGLNDHSLRTIRMILDDYNRGNFSNLVAIGALAAFLADDGASRPAREPDAAAASQFPPNLPPIRNMGDLDDATADLVRLLSAPLAPSDTPMIPSLYRHLAPWPAFLAMAAGSVLAPARLAAALDAGRRLHERARDSAARLAGTMAPAAGIAAPEADEAAAIARIAERFAAGPIAGMVVIGHRLRASLPELPPHRP